MERAGRLFGKLDLVPGAADRETRALAAWPVAAGIKIARHTRAASLVRNTLVVQVGDYVWQQQLSRLRDALLRNLVKELGEAVVTEIDFRPMPPRRQPQQAVSARRANADNIDDPVLALLYLRSRERVS